MTWCKLGTEFADECANDELSDAAFRTHVEAINWLYRVERTDMRIPSRLIRRFAGSSESERAIRELLSLGYWTEVREGYEVVHHGDVVRASVVTQQKKREASKRTSQRHRRKHSEDGEGDTSRDTSRSQSVIQTDREQQPQETWGQR